jgi:hypothetical protein
MPTSKAFTETLSGGMLKPPSAHENKLLSQRERRHSMFHLDEDTIEELQDFAIGAVAIACSFIVGLLLLVMF